MHSIVFKLISSLVMFCLLTYSASAMEPQEYCGMHNASGSSDVCIQCGESCVVLVGLTTICKDCSSSDQCEMTDCANCPDYPACIE